MPYTTVRMKSEEKISRVDVGLLRDQKSNIFFPESIVVSVSVDGMNFVEVASQSYDADLQADNFLGELTLSFPEVAARFVRLTVRPLAQMPQWHSSEGNSAYVFLDEIIVR